LWAPDTEPAPSDAAAREQVIVPAWLAKSVQCRRWMAAARRNCRLDAVVVSGSVVLALHGVAFARVSYLLLRGDAVSLPLTRRKHVLALEPRRASNSP
jgi:hypothetical protein